MASSTPSCGICDLHHVSKSAVIWCSECDEGFCENCSEHHRVSKLSRHHTTTPIDDYQKLPPYILEIEQFCKEHDERFILFCKNHDTPCCRTCSVQKHKQCQYVSRIEDVVQNVKTSNVFLETEQILSELSGNIQKIRKDRKENLESLENSKNQVEKEIKEFRNKVNDHLDKLQDEIINELNKAEEVEREQIQKLIKEMDQNEKNINEIQVNLSNIKQYASDLQAYLAMKHIQTDVEKTDSAMEPLVNSDKLQQKVISFEINKSMKDILSSIKSFGNIIVENKGCKVVTTNKKIQQAQLLVPHKQRTIDEFTLELRLTLGVPSTDLYGCCLLPDGRWVFTTYTNKSLIFMNADGTQNTTLTIPSLAFDVTYVKYNNSLAVSGGYDSKSCITFININSHKVEETIQCNSHSYGLAVKDNILFFTTENSINSLNLINKTITKFTVINLVNGSYIEIYEKNLYHTNYNSNKVTCSNVSGEVKWEFNDESIIKGPYGISIDNQGNVYVACYNTSSVVVISPDGQKSRELLSTKDNLSYPQAIHYDRSTDRLLVPNNNDKTAFLYKVT